MLSRPSQASMALLSSGAPKSRHGRAAPQLRSRMPLAGAVSTAENCAEVHSSRAIMSKITSIGLLGKPAIRYKTDFKHHLAYHLYAIPAAVCIELSIIKHLHAPESAYSAHAFEFW